MTTMSRPPCQVDNMKMSCGCLELHSTLGEIDEMLLHICDQVIPLDPGDLPTPERFIIASDICGGWDVSKTELLMLQVEDLKLGKVTRSTVAENLKSGNEIICYVWEMDHDAMRAHLKKMKPSKTKLNVPHAKPAKSMNDVSLTFNHFFNVEEVRAFNQRVATKPRPGAAPVRRPIRNQQRPRKRK